MARYLEPEQAKLYELIWKRTVASQMESAELERTTVDIAAEAGGAQLDLRATGQVIRFDGFLKLYQVDDDEDGEESRPPARHGALASRSAKETHRRRPSISPSRRRATPRRASSSAWRSSASAGPRPMRRPSRCCRTANMCGSKRSKLVPEDKGRLVTAFLEILLHQVGRLRLHRRASRSSSTGSPTARSTGSEVLRDFWHDFSAAIGGTKELRTTEVLDNLNEMLGPHIFPPGRTASTRALCPACDSGQLSLKLGKFGAFIGCSNYPECKFTRTLVRDRAPRVQVARARSRASAASAPIRRPGQEVTVRDGRFGAYIQLGEGEKPKRSSLPKGVTARRDRSRKGAELLALPREVAKHPTTGEPILAGIGRYGPYVQHGRTYANLGNDDDVLEIGGNRAIDLIVGKESRPGGRGRGGGAPPAGRSATIPAAGSVTVRAGRFGPYVNWGKVNATLPKAMAPDAITLDDALRLIEARAAAQPAGRTAKGRASSKSATKTATKTTAKKPAKAAAKTKARKAT